MAALLEKLSCIALYQNFRKRGRVVECNGLENRRGFTPLVSSNLTASAIRRARTRHGEATGVVGTRYGVMSRRSFSKVGLFLFSADTCIYYSPHST